jgi:hypothetical protein
LPEYAPKSADYADFLQSNPPGDPYRWATCYIEPGNFKATFSPLSCLAEASGKKQYLLIGDSHAAHLYWGLKNLYPEANISQITVTSCPPIYSPVSWSRVLCAPAHEYIYNDYLSHHHVDLVLLSARWVDSDLNYIQETTDWIKQHGMTPVIFGPSFEFDASLTRLLNLSRRQNDPRLPSRHTRDGMGTLDERMKVLARDQWKVPYISMYDDLCNPAVADAVNVSGCPVYALPGVSMLGDTDHYTAAGSVVFATAVRKRGQLPTGQAIAR